MSEDRKTASMHAASSGLVELGEKNFDEMIGGSKPVLVDFWATWCGPCQFMLPIFDKLAKKYGGKVTFGRLNVDDNQGVASLLDKACTIVLVSDASGQISDSEQPKRWLLSVAQRL